MRQKTDYELIAENGGKYALVMGVTRRAKQINDGARPLVDQSALNSVATSIEEVAQGRLKIVPPVVPAKTSPLRQLPRLKRSDDA